MMDELTLIQRIAVWILPVVFAITGHEVAHGWVASRYGDQTARTMGRLTLNPLKHIDPLGTLIIPALMLMTFSGFVFGWAKPVPVDPRHFRKPRQAMMMVSLAGPVSNLLMAIAWALLARVGVTFHEYAFVSMPLIYMGVAGISINLILALVNLLPIPPLDGSRILSGLLPAYWAWQFNRLERYGFMILMLLLVTNLLGTILAGPVYVGTKLLFGLAGM